MYCTTNYCLFHNVQYQILTVQISLLCTVFLLHTGKSTVIVHTSHLYHQYIAAQTVDFHSARKKVPGT